MPTQTPLLPSLVSGLLAVSAPALATAADAPTSLFSQVNGDKELADFNVEPAPGAVSAMGLLGATGEVTTIQNSQDFTVLMKLLDAGNAVGLAFTPARSTLAPMNVSTYNAHWWARLWAGTTFSYAQGNAKVDDKTYPQRAFAVETSAYLERRDDPLLAYWDAIAQAGANPGDASNPCLMPAVAPSKPDTAVAPTAAVAASGTAGGPAVPKTVVGDNKETDDRRSAECRAKAEQRLRWNASRIWASWASGTYKSAAAGGANLSLGRTVVLGASYGFGEAGAKVAGSVSAAVRHTTAEPTLATYALAEPTRKSTNLLTLRASVGTPRMRGLLEASNRRDGDPTAAERVYKRAIGFDFNLRKGMWIGFRAGKQRRVDNQGDETGSSININISPEAMLKL